MPSQQVLIKNENLLVEKPPLERGGLVYRINSNETHANVAIYHEFQFLVHSASWYDQVESIVYVPVEISKELTLIPI